MKKSEEMIYSLIGSLKDGSPIKDIFLEFNGSNLTVTPDDVFKTMYRLMKESDGPEGMIPIIDKAMNLLHGKLSAYEWSKPAKGSFLYFLMEENKGLRVALERYRKEAVRSDVEFNLDGWKAFVGNLLDYNVQLLKLENILFPELEKCDEMFEGLAMLWAMHDRARGLVTEAKELLPNDASDIRFNKMLGKLYFMFYGLMQKQELLLFPAAAAWLDEEIMKRMLMQSDSFGYAFVRKEIVNTKTTVAAKGGLNKEQLEGIFRSLPYDMTFVNKKDEVVFFTEGKRIFPRSESVIGRKVQNCHPPKSMDAVTDILESFKNNESSLAEFWIEHHGKKILIRYIAVRDEERKYLGTLEVTQDITNIQKLEGEKRL